MTLKSAVLFLLFFVAGSFQAQDKCMDCDCTDYPLAEFCVKCCFFQKGTLGSSTEDHVSLVPPPTPGHPKPEAKTFRIGPKTRINKKPLEPGRAATVYYHEVHGELVATRIDVSDYVEGQLMPALLPTPPNDCAVSVPSDSTMVLFGSSGMIADSYPFTAMQINESNLVSVERTSRGGVLISANLYDSKGQLLAEVVDNHFFVKARALQLVQPNKHTLRILDGDKLLVEIQFLNSNTVSVSGTLYGPDGTHIDVGKDELRVNGSTFHGLCTTGGRVGISLSTKPKR